MASPNSEQTQEPLTGVDLGSMIPAYRRQSDGIVFRSAGPGEGHSRFAARLGIDDQKLLRTKQDERAIKGPWEITGYDFGLVEPATDRFWTIPDLEVRMRNEGVAESAPAPTESKGVINHSLFDLFLKNQHPSPTRWLVQNAETMPARLQSLLEMRQRTVAWGPNQQTTGWLFSGVAGEELIKIKSVRWDRAPDLASALDQEKSLTRPLRVEFEIHSADGRIQNFSRTIPELPFPTPWGTYVIGANQELLANKLVQKPGIFPVNLQETGKPDPDRDGILWHTTTASLMQTERTIVAIVRSLTNGLRNSGGRNKAVIIPKEAWPELDSAMGLCRRSNQILDSKQYPRLAAAFRVAHNSDSRLDAALTSWIRELAHAEVPAGSWSTRIERLAGPETGKALAAARTWSLEASNIANNARERIDHSDFIPFSSLARMRTQTGSDLLAEMIAQLIDSRIQEFINNPQHRSLPAASVLSGLWKTTNWRITQDLVAATRTGTDRNNKTLANEKTPAETALRVNLLLREGHLFGTPDDISEIQRNFHSASSMYFLSGITMENASVGNALHLLPRTRVRPETGELEAPFAVRGEDGKWKTKWLGSEELEALEADLVEKGLGLALGRPETMPGGSTRLVNLHFRGQVAARVSKDAIPAYFDAAPEDTLALGLRMSPDNAQVEVARHAIALAFINGASSCYGSQPDPDYSADATETCAQLLNTGKFVRSPVSGAVISVEKHGRIGSVNLQDPNGLVHRIEYPVDLSNAFSNATGMTCVVRPGEVVEKGTPLIAPEQPCVLNSIKLKNPGVFPAVPLRSAEFSIGEEDLLVINSGVQASGKLTILKQGNTAAIQGADGPIRLAVCHPGTMILPGMLLGWQMRQGRDGSQSWKEIRAGDSDRGILANIFVVPDKTGAGHPVEVAPEAHTLKPEMARHIQEIMTGVVTDFAKISKEWSPAVVDYWNAQGMDVKRPYEEAHLWIWSAESQKWESERITLEGVKAGPGSRDYEILRNALSRPTAEIVYGSVDETTNAPMHNYFETRLHNAHRFAECIAGRVAMPPVADFPAAVKRVVFSVIRELPIADGDKGAALGTKGSLAIVHPQKLPMTVVNGEVQSPEISYSVLGFFARSSYGDMKTTTSGRNAAVLKSVVCDPNRGLIEVPVRYGTYRFYRQGESNPDTAASSRGIPQASLDLSRRASGFSLDGQASDGRNGNRADHTLVADARPALEVSYIGHRTGTGFVRDLDLLRSELQRDLPVRPCEEVELLRSNPPQAAPNVAAPSPTGPGMNL